MTSFGEALAVWYTIGAVPASPVVIERSSGWRRVSVLRFRYFLGIVAVAADLEHDLLAGAFGKLLGNSRRCQKQHGRRCDQCAT